MNLSGQLNIVVGVNKDRCGMDKFVSDQMNRAHCDLLRLLGGHLDIHSGGRRRQVRCDALGKSTRYYHG